MTQRRNERLGALAAHKAAFQGDASAANPEAPDSGSGPSDRPEMTN